MTKVTVAVELHFDTADPATLRDLARREVEAAGLKVARVTIPKRKDPKPFTPKAWSPGLNVTADGVTYQIWSQAPGHRANTPEVFAVPVVFDPDGPPLVKIRPVRGGLRVEEVNTAGGPFTRPAPELAAAA